MFEHSVKVPRHYKIAANIFKKVSTEGGSVKTLLYDDKLRHFKTNVLFALITETIKHAADIDKIFEHYDILKTESRLDPWLAKVLTTELLFGKKTLPGKSKPEQTILSYKEKFESYVSEHQDDMKNEVKPRPRYVRVNTNLFTTSDAIRTFQDEGFRFIRCTSGSYNDYLEQIQKLTEYDFTQDYHVKTLFVFAPGTKWHDHELYLENKILLQDKATAMAVHLLAPPTGSTVLDMCAAPGMKTTQLAAYMRNEGKIYAVERNEKRYETLCDFVEKTGCKCVETFNKDSLTMQRGEYDDVEYILLDPSCSGSGMDFCVHNYVEASRLAKLTSLQEKFLKHAMNAFPNAKRIVYSTCSLYPEENERVITNVVKTSRAKWRVQDVKELLKGQWNNFGSGMYGSMGTRCLYAKPESDLTTGFFLAVLDRDEKDLAKANTRKEGNLVDTEDGTHSDVKIKKKRDKKKVESTEIAGNEEITKESPKKKKKNKHKNNIDSAVVDEDNNTAESTDKKENFENSEVDQEDNISKKKKKKDKCKDTEIGSENTMTELHDDKDISSKKKKSKYATTELENGSIEIYDNESSNKSKKKKRKAEVDNKSIAIPNNGDDATVPTKKKKKDKHKNHDVESNNTIDETNDNSIGKENDENEIEDVTVSKKKKKKDKMKSSGEELENSVLETNDDDTKRSKKSKKRKHDEMFTSVGYNYNE